MSSRPYRVVKTLPWIEGGKPAAPPVLWEGGRDVIYEVGDTIDVEDHDLPDVYNHLEALDDAGRAALEELRIEAEAPAQMIAVADLSPAFRECLASALAEKRRVYGCYLERDITVLHDGSEQILRARYVPTKPLPGVIHGDNGLPDGFATAIRDEQLAKEKDQLSKEIELDRIHRGGDLGRRRSHEAKRDKTVRNNKALLADVQAYRTKHPNHGGPAIATALVDKHGRIRDHAASRGREKAIEALRKRIARLEKSLDT